MLRIALAGAANTCYSARLAMALASNLKNEAKPFVLASLEPEKKIQMYGHA